MSMRNENVLPVLGRVRNVALICGFFGAVALIVGAVIDLQAFFASFMFGWVFWMMLTMGGITLTYLHHCIRAQWSSALIRIFESGNKNVWYMGVLSVVLIGGVLSGRLYQWTNVEYMKSSEVLSRKLWALNPTGFVIFTIFVFLYWWFTTSRLNASSARQDDLALSGASDAAMKKEWDFRSNRAAPWGVIHVVLLTFAATYWIMSLDPLWYSTIYGVWWMIYGIRLMMVTSVFIVVGMRLRRPYNEVVTSNLTRDIGNVMLGFTMMWGYFSLSQFLIIWSGNLPEEIPFYVNRFEGPMVVLGGFLVFFQFFAPFLALIAGRTKREPKLLLNVARMVFFVSILDAFWQVTPFFRVGAKFEYWPNYALDLGAWAGIGGVWVYLFLGNVMKFAKANVLLPLHDTRLIEEKLEIEHHA